MSRRLSFTEDRRRKLRRQMELLRLESRTTITEPISFTGLAVSWMRGVVGQLGLISPFMGSNALSGLGRQVQKANQAQALAKPVFAPRRNLLAPILSVHASESSAGGAGGAFDGTDPALSTGIQGTSNDWLSLTAAPATDGSESHGISLPWHPAKPNGGGAAMAPRGGSNPASPLRTSSRGAITPLQLPPSTPAASSAGGSAALLAAAASAGGNGGAAAAVTAGTAAQAAPNGSSSHNPQSGVAPVGGAPSPTIPVATPFTGSGGSQLPGSTPDPVTGNSSPPTQQTFTYFPMYVLDINNGVTLYPGVNQLARLGGLVDLEAQVSGATVSSYNWNTTGLGTDVSSLSVTNTYLLSFNWETSNPGSAHTDSVTLSVKDSSNQFETFTYDFLVPVASAVLAGSLDTWPTSLPPSSELISAPSFDSDNASVDATSGSLDTEIDLPSYNPNVPALALTYDSIAASPTPIVVFENTLSASAAVPSKVSAQLTFNSTALTNYYFTTSQLNPGDVQQIALEATNATTLTTNRYAYSAQVVDIGTTNTTSTYSGTTTLLNYSGNAFGAGWTLQGLEKITAETGGVILDLGQGGRTLWFTGSFGSGGGTFTDPAGEFSTLVQNSGGSYTDTLTDGTQITFNSSGYETATIDLNNQHITYSYSGGNLTSIEDNYTNLTTLSYSGGYLQTIEDPATRVATFAHSGGNLTEATLPDSSTWNYAYASGGQLTQITDPRSHTVTIAYDSASRVGTISRPDSTHETFTNDQESGWTNSGTSGSPAAPTLLAQAGGTYTSPNSNTTTIQPDWMGLGMTGNQIDALGDVQMYDLNSNGLATVAVDQVNRVTSFAYDSSGNTTKEVYPDGNSESYTFNSDSQPLTFVDANANTTSYTYSGGNLVVVKDPMGNLTSMGYTSTGRLTTTEDSDSHTTTILYDSQDRPTTIQFPDGTTNLYTYNSQGNVTKSVDGRNNATTHRYDALNRETGETDALTDLTTLTYDSGGNLTVDQEPTPASQTARTTTYAYDSMNRLTTVTAPLSLTTVSSFDSDGNNVKVKDPLGRVTTTVFDALDRPTVVIDPMSGHTTTTYDGDSEVTQVVDPMGRITTIAFDNRGWVATVTDPLGNVTTNSYTATGKTSTVSSPGTSGGGSQSYFYDKDDRLTTLTDANSNTTLDSYDGVGNQITTTDQNGKTTTYAYDTMNRVTTITDPKSDTVLIGYDSGGNQQTVTDGLGHTTTTLFDALNRATTITSAISGTTTITFDAAGRETSLTDPVGNKTQWAYDADDRVTTLTQPNGFTVTSVYDSGGELTDTTDADGRRTTFSYNADYDQTGETWVSASPAETITNTYDADNELTGAADSFATLTFTYDSGGNEITAATSGSGTGQPSVTLTSGYNAQHSLTSVTDNLSSVGIVTYSYDGGQRLTTITTSFGGVAGPQILTSYAANNQISSQSRTIAGSGTQVNSAYSYDSAERQTTITQQKFVPSMSGGTTTPLTTIVYTYDAANRVTSEKDAEGTASFSYDNSNQLTTVTGSRTESYSYDVNGNRNGTGYSTTVMNETLTSPGVTYTYDHAGNMISANSGGTLTTYTYDYHNRLTEVKQGGTLIATYVYDALDRRIGIQEGGGQTWTVYNGTSADALPYADFNGSATLLTRYVSGPGMVNGAVVDELLSRTSSGGTTAWYLPDKLDSVRDIVSSAGSVLDHIIYDSFGNITTETSASNGDRFKYAGMEYDSVTGQYYDRARYYGSTTGRFTSQDPMGLRAGDDDLYRYVTNSPLAYTDVTGLQPPRNQPDPLVAKWWREKAQSDIDILTWDAEQRALNQAFIAGRRRMIGLYMHAAGEDAAAITVLYLRYLLLSTNSSNSERVNTLLSTIAQALQDRQDSLRATMEAASALKNQIEAAQLAMLAIRDRAQGQLVQNYGNVVNSQNRLAAMLPTSRIDLDDTTDVAALLKQAADRQAALNAQIKANQQRIEQGQQRLQQNQQP